MQHLEAHQATGSQIDLTPAYSLHHLPQLEDHTNSGVSNGQLEITSLEREEGIPFTGRDWRLGQSLMVISEMEEGSTDSEKLAFYQPHFATLELIEIHTSYVLHPNLPFSSHHDHLEETWLPPAHGDISACSDVATSSREKSCLYQDPSLSSNLIQGLEDPISWAKSLTRSCMKNLSGFHLDSGAFSNNDLDNNSLKIDNLWDILHKKQNIAANAQEDYCSSTSTLALHHSNKFAALIFHFLKCLSTHPPLICGVNDQQLSLDLKATLCRSLQFFSQPLQVLDVPHRLIPQHLKAH
ncbi:hypothetical protein H5410_057453 [Solanum commersonii]|uniref:Uncharacterized protein n=1 Tax=Solanum commersonii TaxID=4109 RepID=A0A9J5WQ40_SOLCO|nr:hypothetical protein H5410_057453 [Solanum commersonii]